MQPTQWRETAAARGLKTTDLSEHVGTRIEGLRLSDPLDRETMYILRAACAERIALLFSDQDELDPAHYLGFARSFGGRPDLHTQRHYCLKDHHEIFVVGNVEEAGKKIGASRVGLNWHTDHYHLPEPACSPFSMRSRSRLSPATQATPTASRRSRRSPTTGRRASSI